MPLPPRQNYNSPALLFTKLLQMVLKYYIWKLRVGCNAGRHSKRKTIETKILWEILSLAAEHGHVFEKKMQHI